MSKLKILGAFLALALILPCSAQFLDPEKKAPSGGGQIVDPGDGFFPEIIPEHGSGEEVVIIEQQIEVITNEIQVITNEVQIISNTVERVVEQQVIISNIVEKVVEQVTIVSNIIEQVEVQVNNLSNDVVEVQETKLDNNVEALTNSTDFIQAVQTVSSTNVWPKMEFDLVKENVVLYHDAFEAITNINISEETNIDELKTAILLIRQAAIQVMAR